METLGPFEGGYRGCGSKSVPVVRIYSKGSGCEGTRTSLYSFGEGSGDLGV